MHIEEEPDVEEDIDSQVSDSVMKEGKSNQYGENIYTAMRKKIIQWMKVPTKDVLFKAHIQHFDIDYKTHIFLFIFSDLWLPGT